MLSRLLLPLALLGATAACSTDGSTEAGARSKTADQRRQAIAQLRIPLAQPVLLDSSAYVFYPLPLNEVLTEESSSYGSSYSRQDTYWNILFHNTRSGETHLLAPGRKMVIQHYYVAHSYGNEVNSPAHAARSEPLLPVEKLIFYLATTADGDRNGELTAADPTYLFVSDKTGNNFQQISPDSLHVTNWVIQKSTGKILLQTVRDSNHNREFGEGDEVIPYLYDPATRQPAVRILTPALNQQLKAAFQQNWKKTPEK